MCWSRKNAKLEPRLLIHVDMPPPYRHLTPDIVPTCYHLERHVTVKPDAINAFERDHFEQLCADARR